MLQIKVGLELFMGTTIERKKDNFNLGYWQYFLR